MAMVLTDLTALLGRSLRIEGEERERNEGVMGVRGEVAETERREMRW